MPYWTLEDLAGEITERSLDAQITACNRLVREIWNDIDIPDDADIDITGRIAPTGFREEQHLEALSTAVNLRRGLLQRRRTINLPQAAPTSPRTCASPPGPLQDSQHKSRD